MTFELLPAIDLRDGRVVRLLRGDFAAETAYADDPVAVARAFVGAGARWLHVVDLDGARHPADRQASLIESIVAGAHDADRERRSGPGTTGRRSGGGRRAGDVSRPAAPTGSAGPPELGVPAAATVLAGPAVPAEAAGSEIAVEVAGGLRDEVAVAEVLGIGAARAVLGTAALADPGLAGRLVERHGAERVAVALDVRDGLAVGHGWSGGGLAVEVRSALRELAAAGVVTFEVTAIERDGTLEGPDVALLGGLAAEPGVRIVASGGISTVADIRAVREVGCVGAIVGRALYEGALSLADALAAAR